jgi:major membrane immunogen (membrane-anchored lipoprotein)
MKKTLRNRILFLATVLLSLASFSSCDQDFSVMQDGSYTAESAEFDANGWKEFVTILVRGNRIAAVEYDAKNGSGFVKSWDMNYMLLMDAASGTYPDEYTRVYASELLAKQNAADVDVLSGATESHRSFCVLAESAIQHARRGDTSVAFVTIAPYGE